MFNGRWNIGWVELVGMRQQSIIAGEIGENIDMDNENSVHMSVKQCWAGMAGESTPLRAIHLGG